MLVVIVVLSPPRWGEHTNDNSSRRDYYCYNAIVLQMQLQYEIVEEIAIANYNCNNNIHQKVPRSYYNTSFEWEGIDGRKRKVFVKRNRSFIDRKMSQLMYKVYKAIEEEQKKRSRRKKGMADYF